MSTIRPIGSLNVVRRSSTLRPLTTDSSSTSTRKAALARVGVRDFMTKLVDAGEALKHFQATFGETTTGRVRTTAARVLGDTRIDLDTTSTRATLTSSEEISTRTTDIDDRTPTWGKSLSTAQMTIHGTFTGSRDVRFEVHADATNPFTVGQRSAYALALYKDGALDSNVTVASGYTANDRIAIGDGLEISFSEGDILARDRLAFDAQTGLDLTAQAALAFDGSKGDPYLDSTVSAGSFELNGETIAVLDTDSVDSVLAAVNASAAGVTAAHDSISDEVSLASTEGSIVLGRDTSGFLAAMKLDTATEVRTQGGALGQAIEDVSALSGISSGSFVLNGVSFSIDVSTDSLQDIFDVVGSSSANATMAYSAHTDRITLRATEADESLTLATDSTGLFSSFGIEAGTFQPRSSRGLRGRTIDDIVEQVHNIKERVNRMAGTVTNEGLMGDDAMTARNTIRTAIQTNLDRSSTTTIQSGIGLDFHVTTDSARPFLQFGSAGETTLERVLKVQPGRAIELLFGTPSETGLIDAMLAGLDEAQNALIARYGSVGILLDISV